MSGGTYAYSVPRDPGPAADRRSADEFQEVVPMGGFQDRDKFHPDEVVLSAAEKSVIAELLQGGGRTEPAESTDEG